MNGGAFGENFPYSNFHDLNMDWIIKIAKDFLDQYSHIQETLNNGLEELDNKADELEALLQQWYDTHSEDIANQLADALNDLNAWYTEHEGYLDQYVTNSIASFNQAADQKAQQTIASIPEDYTTLSNKVNAISKPTYNIVTGVMADRTISNTGRLEYDANLMIFYAPVESGKYYTVLTNESSLICAFYESEPTPGAYSYNQQRIIQTSKTIQAPINGFLVCRAIAPYEETQIVEGTETKPYLPPITAIDAVARYQIDGAYTAIDEAVKRLEDEILVTPGTLYTGLSASDTFKDYNEASGYSICEIKAKNTLNKVSLLAPSGTSPRLWLVWNDNGTYHVEYVTNLANGTGQFVDNDIDYIVNHDCLIVISGGFGFSTNASVEKPLIFTFTDSDDVNTVRQGTAGLKYTAEITYTQNGALFEIQNDIEKLEQKTNVDFIASSLSLFENIGVCGDSYAAGMIVISENPTVNATNPNLSWGKNLERQLGVNVSLYAKGGVKASDYITDSDCLPALVADTAKQLYIISLGHNDMYNHIAKATFIQNYYTIIDAIQNHAPNAKIILCKQSRPYANYEPSLNDAIEEIAEHYDIPVIDPENDPYTSSETWLNTMVHNHPTFAGYAGMAQAINRQFAFATVEYFDYFKGYTGT